MSCRSIRGNACKIVGGSSLAWIKEEDLKAIRQQADIVEILDQYVTLEKKGRSYVAVCPFHDDHDPSLSISTEKQIFKCFVCGTGGNVFSFVQQIENITFPEAVVKIADMIGYPLQMEGQDFSVKENENQPLFDVLQNYIRFLQYELQSQDGLLAMDYLQKRKMNEDVIRRFEIGYAPDIQRNTQFLQAQNISEQIGKDTGVLMEGRAVFHDRITIPIHDENGNPLGFTARTLSKNEDVPKYINTSQTKIYEKGNVVFNYHRAKSFARKNKRCILAEGAMDVLAFEKADIHESVACLGTACTNQQLLLLKRLQVPIVVCYDGDKAGQNATYKFVKLAINQHMDVQVVKNDTGLDPDEIFDQQGKEGLSAFVSKTISVVDFLFDYGQTYYNLENYDDRKTFGQEMFEVIHKTCQAFEKPAYFQRLKTLTGFDFSKMELERERPQVPRPTSASRRIPLTPMKESGRTQAEKAVLSMMLISKMACNRFKDEVGYFQNGQIRDLANYIYDAYRQYTKLDLDILLARIDDENTRNFLMKFWEDPMRMRVFNEDYLNDGLLKIQKCIVEDELIQIKRHMATTQSPEEKEKWMKKRQSVVLKREELNKRRKS